jgi:hypothetical protein
MATSIDSKVKGNLTTSFAEAHVGGSVELNVVITEGTALKVEFMQGNTLIGTLNQAPYSLDATNLAPGIHHFYAKVFENEKFNTTNSVSVVVGNQLPYGGSPNPVPGVIEAGKYDVFEGGKGQNISYLDLSAGNNGDFRMDESVDVANHQTEGATIGWIDAGEWVEYTVQVAETGMYSMAFRYASGNAAGGGPFKLELNGQSISQNITVPSTSTSSWNVWATRTVTEIPLPAGTHVLRLSFASGEFNLGRMTFTRTGNLPYSIPVASAGADMKVLLPQTSFVLDGSASFETASKTLTYSWQQVYGPTVVTFSNHQQVSTTVSNIKEGMYKFRLTVANTDARISQDEVLVMVTSTANIPPTVAIISPLNNTTFTQGKPVTLTATASDFDGTVTMVDFYAGESLVGSVNTAPYSIVWNPIAGNYSITARATDNGGAVSVSNPVSVTIAPSMMCTERSTQASQGSFTTGYIATFETVGSNVTITFELLDEKSGVIAYLWKQTPFTESPMTNIGGKKFSATVGGLTHGTTISYACKFAFAGGMSVTKYFNYVVGTDCGQTSVEKVTVNEAFFYPNPVESFVKLNLNGSGYRVSVFDIAGSMVYDDKHSGDDVIDMTHFRSGIYFIRAENDDTIYNAKLIRK